MSKITISDTEKYEPLKFNIQKTVTKKTIFKMFDSLEEIINLCIGDKFELKLDIKEIIEKGTEQK